jgi:periplasmic protein TonB
MERPSHITFDTQSHYFSRRLPMIGLALSLQLAGVWLFTHGLMDIGKVNIFRPGPIDLRPVHDPEKPTVKPPEPKVATKIKNETVKPPIFTTENPRGENTITLQRPTSNDPPVTKEPDRALASIAGTHTAPPYPPIARRIGAEGKVTLRLTVSAEGKVTAAQIVSSSGRDDMDQGARQWIMAHWTYKPALANGVPAISQTLATVIFSLTNER